MQGFRNALRYIALVAIVPVAIALSPTATAALPSSVPGSAEKTEAFDITPPWTPGVTHKITQAYGSGLHDRVNDARANNDYYAVDADLSINEDVFPVAPGRVVYAGAASGPWASYGNIVFIDHQNGYQSIYAHLQGVAVRTGQLVDPGVKIGGAGGTGGWPVHLHFAVYKGASFYNTPLGIGPYGGQAVRPEPISGCSKAGRSCENLTTGDRLAKATSDGSFLSTSPRRPEGSGRADGGSGTPTTVAPLLRWEPPADATAVQLQVVPLNDDGASIDLILTDPDSLAGQHALPLPKRGVGDYVLMKGASYQWRVRVTTKPAGQTVEPGDWGAWSPLSSFALPRPTGDTVRVQFPPKGSTVSSGTPTITWLDNDSATFYYEVQVSRDSQFRTGEAAIAPVYWNLVNGGITNPLNSWQVPAESALPSGVYYVRVRPRVQATALGAAEPGVDWSPVSAFTVAAGR